MDSHCFKLHRSYLISLNLSNVGKIFWLESEGTVSKFWKRKRKFLCVLTYPIKRARQIRKFHVAVVQRRLRNIQKSVMHVQSCYFANVNLLLFYRSRWSPRRRCSSFLLLWSKNFATMVTWRYTSPLSWTLYTVKYSKGVWRASQPFHSITVKPGQAFPSLTN